MGLIGLKELSGFCHPGEGRGPVSCIIGTPTGWLDSGPRRNDGVGGM